MDDKELSNLNKSLLTVVQQVVGRIFSESQKIVPVRSGALKESGSIKYTSDGGTITYAAPYASNLMGDAETDPNYKYVVRQHQRRLPSGKQTTVKEHMRPMGVRPIRVTGNIQTSSGFSYTKDDNFMTRAIDTVLSDGGTIGRFMSISGLTR